MALDLTLGEAVRAASGFLFVPFGLIVLARRSESPRAVPLGVFLLAFGPGVALANFSFEERVADTANEAISGTFLVVALLAMLRLILVETTDRRRALIDAGIALGLGAIAWAISIASGLLSFIVEQDGSQTDLTVLALRQASLVVVCSVVGAYLVVAAERARSTSATDARALAALATGLALYPLAFFASGNPSGGILVSSLVGALPLFAGIVAWARAAGGPASRAARAAVALMVALPTAVAMDALLDDDVGTIGILRVVVLGIIAFAVFRLDVLGASARPTRDRRAALLTAFLVILLIVAQVAQNFLSAQYGLLMGGVVAGALVFAANPLQRALERSREPGEPDRAPRATPENEDAYRRALRIALRDRAISPEEEVHIADLGERLGIRAGRARELRHEIEREVAAKEARG